MLRHVPAPALTRPLPLSVRLSPSARERIQRDIFQISSLKGSANSTPSSSRLKRGE